MSERLGEEELARIHELSNRLVGPGPKASHVSASECHEIADGVDAMLVELRARRAKDLSSEEREALCRLLDELRTWREVRSHFEFNHGPALAALTRVLSPADVAAGGGK